MLKFISRGILVPVYLIKDTSYTEIWISSWIYCKDTVKIQLYVPIVQDIGAHNPKSICI